MVVGVAYIAAMMLAGMMFGMLGLVPADGGNAAASLFWILIAGILLGLYLGPLAARTTATRRQHVLIWTAVIFFNMGAVMLEGAYFAPDLVPIPAPLLAVQQFLAALVAGSLIALLFARPGQTAAFRQTLRRRSWFAWLWRFLLASLSYLLFYLVFGALNYNLVTGPYYASHAAGSPCRRRQQSWRWNSSARRCWCCRLCCSSLRPHHSPAHAAQRRADALLGGRRCAADPAAREPASAAAPGQRPRDLPAELPDRRGCGLAVLDRGYRWHSERQRYSELESVFKFSIGNEDMSNDTKVIPGGPS